MKKLTFSMMALGATLLASTSVFAQAALPGGVADQGSATTVAATGNTTAGMGLPGPQAAAVAGDSDHDMMVGSFALGYLGRRSIPFGDAAAAAAAIVGGAPAAAAGSTQAPIIGARYWIDPVVGLDAGVGFSFLGDGKTKDESPTQTVESELAPVTGFLVHVGLPLALSNTGHFSFQVIPEANVGYATQTVDLTANQGPEVKGHGLAFDIGARGGAEIHFGFIGVPQLSLQGSIGLLYRLEQWQIKATVPGAGTTTHTETRGSFTTTVYDNPWNIFTSNVAALYYF